MTASAHAQYRLGNDGRLFDMNPELNSGGYNWAPRPVSPLLGSNWTATGNARFGQSLRIDSPISDSTAFSGSLGSSSLSGFVRDSVSVLDNRFLVNSPGPTGYYDPSRTAPTASYLRGTSTYAAAGLAPSRNSLGFSQSIQSPLPGLLQYSGPIDSRLSQPAFRDETPIAEYRPEYSSSIFGFNEVRLPQQLDIAVRETTPQFDRSFDEALRTVFGDDLSQQASEDEGLTPTSIDRLLHADPRSMLEQRGLGLPTNPVLENRVFGSLHETGQSAETEEDPQLAARTKAALNLRDMGLLPGMSVFTDLQLAMNLMENPGADWFGDMQNTVRNDPRLSVEYQEFAAMQANEFTEKVLKAPLETFVADANDQFNQQMGQAEELMASGRYRDAATRYETAALFDPANPLPLIGQGHAMLAAGDYLSASISLIRGFERYPEMARVTLDLTRLLGGGEVVDIRRADIMARLERHDDPRLRFLLGYIEIHTGFRDRGMQNLERAAGMAEIGSILKRFPSLVRGEKSTLPATTQPAKTPRD